MASSTRTVNVKFDGDAKGLQRAARDGEREVDRFNKSVDKKFRKSGDDSGKSFNQTLKKWFSPSSLGKTGKEGGTVFGSGFLGALKTPVLGPAIAGALAAAVAVAAPAAGAIAASGLVLAFGAGLAGLGIVFAAKSKVVQDTWKKTLSGMGAQMTLLSKPFESTLVSIAGFAQRTFDKFAPSLEAAFKEIAPTVTRFADTVSKGLEKLQPAVRPLAEAFDAVLDSLGPAIQGAIGRVSDGLIKLSESVKKNPDGLADLVDGMGKLADNTLSAIGKLNDFNGLIKDMTGGTSAVDLVFGKANSKIGEFIGKVKSAIDPLGGLKSAFDALFGSADKTTGAVGLTGDATKYFTQGLDDNAAKAILAGDANKDAAGKVESLAAKFDRQWQATQRANQELFRNSGLLLTLSGSEIAYQQAIDDATESIKQNGKTHDINTEKGRANKTALDQVSASANAQTEAMRNAGDGNVSAAKHGEEARKNFVKLAEQMGYTKPQAEAMAKSMIAIPNVSRTAKLTANKKDLEKKLADAQAELKNPNLTKERRAKLTADIANAKSGISTINGMLGNLPKSKTVNITVNTYKNLIETTIDRGLVASGKGVPRASGGPSAPKRRYLLGERGPEIAEFGGTGTGGPKILSAEQTSRELASSNQPLIVENHIEIGGEVVRVVRTEIKANDKYTKRRTTAGVRTP